VYDDNGFTPVSGYPTSRDQTSAQQLHEPLLTADDIAAWLAVPRSSVYEYARREREPLPAVRIGRHLRFVRAEVSAWIGAQRESDAVTSAPAALPDPPTDRMWWHARPPQERLAGDAPPDAHRRQGAPAPRT